MELDPQHANGPSSYFLNASIFDTLTAVDADGWTLSPRLAESWEPSAGLTEWRFTLRKGVTFHDGRPLDAKNVVWTFRRIFDESVGAGSFSRFARTMTPEGLAATDASTVTIRLKGPDSLLPYSFAEPATAIVKDGESVWTPETYMGTGPYTLVSWAPGQSFEVARNPNYWDPELPHLDGIRKVAATEVAVATQGVLSGSFGIAEAISYAGAAGLGASPGAQPIRLPNTTSLVLVMDSTQAPFTDERMRRAFKLAIDRKVVLDTAFPGFGAVTSDLMLAPTDAYYPDGLGRAPTRRSPSPSPSPTPRRPPASGRTSGRATPTRIRRRVSARPLLRHRLAAVLPPRPALVRLRVGRDNESKLKLPRIDELYNKTLATTDVSQQQTFVKEGLGLAATSMGHIIPVMADQLLLAKARVKGVTRCRPTATTCAVPTSPPDAATGALAGRPPRSGLLASSARQAALALLTLLAVSVVTFFATSIKSPADVARGALGRQAAPEQITAFVQAHGLGERSHRNSATSELAHELVA